MSLSADNVGFIGSGQMMKALAKGLIGSGLIKADKIITSDKDENMLRSVRDMGIRTTHDNKETVNKSDVIVLAVKPGIIPKVLNEIKDLVTKNKLIVSIAAGVTLQAMEKILPKDSRVVRVMPNTPALVQAGATYIAPGAGVIDGDIKLVKTLFNSIGICEVGSEDMVNAATGLSGSGPAYIFAAIEAMADGGVKMGFPRDVALKFAAQTCMGAAKMVLDTGKHPGELKDSVCSPGGTTIVAMHCLEKNGFRGALIDAVEASAKRAIEIGNNR